MSNRKLHYVLAFVLGSVAWGHASADSHGAQVMICAPADTLRCEAGGQCTRGEAADINLDHFIRIDLNKKTATGVASGRVSPIGSVGVDNGQIVVHGAQNGRAWSMTVGESSGEMTIAVAGEKFSFTVFGACMAAE